MSAVLESQTSPRRRCGSGLAARWKFFRQWLRHPLSTAAVAPSSEALAAKMLQGLPSTARRVIELGAGTGVFTRALLRAGIPAHDLLAVELNPSLHAHLQAHFPDVATLRADAVRLREDAIAQTWLQRGRADAIVSGLGLLSMDASSQHGILASAFDAMGEDGVFVQFTYGPQPPLRRQVADELGLQVRRVGFVWRNLPPATVYAYSRRKGEGEGSGHGPRRIAGIERAPTAQLLAKAYGAMG